jgi:hypothetical protein
MDWPSRVRVKLISDHNMDTLSCIFCGRTPTTKEHIFSEWIHKHLGQRGHNVAYKRISVQHLDRSDFIRDIRFPGQIRDWQIKCVCGNDPKSCNNGWMRQLEEAADPVMTPLILGQSATLSPEDQKIIASWAVLKAVRHQGH